MKKLLFCLLLGASAFAYSDSTTPRLKLTLPTVGSPSWGQKINGDLQIIDGNVVVGTGTGSFAISTITAGSGISVINSTGPNVIISATGGGGGSGVSVYNATSTIGAPFGAFFSTITLNQTLTGNVNTMVLTSTGTGIPLSIIPNGFVSNGYQNQKGALTIGDTNPLRPFSTYLVVTDSSPDAQNGGGMVEIWSNNPNHNDPKLWFHIAAHDSSPEIRDDAYAPNWEMINLSTDNAHGLGKWEPAAVAFQGVDLQVNNRAYNNSTFETIGSWHPLSKLDIMPGLYISAQNVSNDGGILTSSDTAGIHFFSLNGHTVGLTGPQNPTATYIFALPDTVGSAGNMLYNNGNRGGNFNVRQWKWTGSDLLYNSSGLTVSTLTVNNQMSGAGLTNCSDATHAVSWNSTTKQFGCQAISGSGGSGTPGGADTYVQFNQTGVFSGTQTLTMNATSNLLTVGATTTFSSVGSVNYTNFSTVTYSAASVIFDNQSTTTFQNQMLDGNGSAGSASQVWTSNGSGAAPTWQASGGGGGGGGGYAVQPATVTFQLNQGFSASTGVFSGAALFNGPTNSTFTYGVTVGSITLQNQGNTRIVFMNGANLGTSSTFTWNGTTMTATDVAAATNLASQTGIFTSTVSLLGRMSVAAGATASPSLYLSSDPTFGINFQNIGISIVKTNGGNAVSLASFTGASNTISYQTTFTGEQNLPTTVAEDQNSIVLNAHPGTNAFQYNRTKYLTTSIGGNIYNGYAGTRLTDFNTSSLTTNYFIISGSTGTLEPTSDAMVIAIDPALSNYGSVGIGVSSPTAKLSVAGFINTATDTAHPVPIVSACGTGFSLSAGATDTNGTITAGTGAPTTCTLTFGTSKTKVPICVVSGSAAFLNTESTSALTITGSAFTSATINYICLGNE